MRGHRDRAGIQAAEGDKVAGGQFGGAGRDPGQRQVAVGPRPAMAGDMLHDRQDTAVQQAVNLGPAQRDDGVGVMGKSPVADDVMGAGDRDIQHRQAVHIDAQPGQVMGDQAGIEIGGLPGGLRIGLVQGAETGGRRALAPLGRLEAGDAAAFLVNQDGRVTIVNRGAQLFNQIAHLRRTADVAREENEPPGAGLAKEIPFGRRQGFPRAAIDGTAAHGYFPRKQLPPSAFSRSQVALAPSRSAKPAIRRRYQVPFSPSSACWTSGA